MSSFPRTARLHRPEDFAAVKREGIGVGTGTFRVFVFQRMCRRLGVITSRRIGKAHLRNRLRRIVREHFRLHQQSYPQGDCVVIPSLRVAAISSAEVRMELEKALSLLQKKLGRS